MASTIQARQVVRSQPYRTQQVYMQQNLGIAGTLVASFDIAIITTDRNQLAGQTTVGPIPSVGPLLDVSVIATQIGTIDINVQIDEGAGPYPLLAAPIAVAVNTLVTISGLRVPGRFIYVVFTNTSGVNPNLVDFGAFMGSN